MFERVYGINDQSRFEVLLEGLEPAFVFATAPSGVRFGVTETDPESGAHDLKMVAGEDLALVGVEFIGEAAPSQCLTEAIQEPAELFGLVILRMRNQP